MPLKPWPQGGWRIGDAEEAKREVYVCTYIQSGKYKKKDTTTRSSILYLVQQKVHFKNGNEFSFGFYSLHLLNLVVLTGGPIQYSNTKKNKHQSNTFISFFRKFRVWYIIITVTYISFDKNQYFTVM